MLRALCAGLLAASALLAGPAYAEKRVALVIGNADYRHVTSLANPANDARLMAETLSRLGFTLAGGGVQLNLDKPGFDRAVQDFGERLLGAEVGLFYYAGHGVQVRGANFLVPVNANPRREADVDFQMLDTRLVLRQMESAGTRLNLVILDACRNNPFGGRGLRATGSGLAQMQAPEGTLISFATQPGNVAADGSDGHSPFTAALASVIRKPGLGLFEAFNEVGLSVKRATGGSQQPWLSSSPIDGNFYFAGRTTAPPAAAAPVKTDDVAALRARLKALEDSLKARSDPRPETPPLKPTETARLPPAPAPTPATSLESMAQAFLVDYMRRSEGPPDDLLAYVRRTFAADVDYYGERLSNQKILDQTRRYIAKWPQRRYVIKPDTTRIACDQGRASCLVSGELDFHTANPATSRQAAGVTTYEFRVNFTASGPRIVSENGRVISRR